METRDMRELLKDVEQYWIYLQDQKIDEEKKARCQTMCGAVKTMVDTFLITEQSERAIEFLMYFGDVCLLTCMVEYNIPLHFQMDFLEVDGIKIRIDSLLGAIVGDVDEEQLVELMLDRKFVDKLLEEIANYAKRLRQKNELVIVDRYKNEEYTAELKMRYV